MNKEQEHRIRLRREYTRETGEMATDNIPAYADWLEKKLGGNRPIECDHYFPLKYSDLTGGEYYDNCVYCGEGRT